MRLKVNEQGACPRRLLSLLTGLSGFMRAIKLFASDWRFRLHVVIEVDKYVSRLEFRAGPLDYAPRIRRLLTFCPHSDPLRPKIEQLCIVATRVEHFRAVQAAVDEIGRDIHQASATRPYPRIRGGRRNRAAFLQTPAWRRWHAGSPRRDEEGVSYRQTRMRGLSRIYRAAAPVSRRIPYRGAGVSKMPPSSPAQSGSSEEIAKARARVSCQGRAGRMRKNSPVVSLSLVSGGYA